MHDFHPQRGQHKILHSVSISAILLSLCLIFDLQYIVVFINVWKIENYHSKITNLELLLKTDHMLWFTHRHILKLHFTTHITHITNAFYRHISPMHFRHILPMHFTDTYYQCISDILTMHFTDTFYQCISQTHVKKFAFYRHMLKLHFTDTC